MYIYYEEQGNQLSQSNGPRSNSGRKIYSFDLILVCHRYKCVYNLQDLNFEV